MTLGTQIALLRKQNNITQEALAQQLGFTNQAVSKWESDQCCPDVTLLPKIADIFSISIDELFGRSAPSTQNKLPEDGTLRVVLFQGNHRLMDRELCKDVTIHWQGKVGDLRSDFSVSCGDVNGYVQAGGSVNCGDIEGPVSAGGNVNCGDIEGDLAAGGKVTCGDISGNVTMVEKRSSDDDSRNLIMDTLY